MSEVNAFLVEREASWDPIASDNSAAVQSAFDAAAAGGSTGVPAGRIILPPGVTAISSSLLIDRQAIILEGQGIGNSGDYSPNRGRGSTLRWTGSAGSPMVHITDSRHVRIRDIHFQGRTAAKPSAGIYFEGDGGSVGTNERCFVERCLFGEIPWTVPSNGGDMDYGIHVGGATNSNNDQFAFVDCVFDHCTTAGVAIDNTQSIWGHLANCHFNSCAKGLTSAANVQAYNLTFNRSTNVDVEATNTGQITIFGMHSEHAVLCLRATESGGKIGIYGGMLSLQDEMVGDEWADHQSCGGGGYLILHGVWINNQLGTQPNLKVRGNTSGVSGVLSVRDCLGLSNLATSYDVQAGSGSGGLVVNIESRGTVVRRTLTASAAMTASDSEWQLPAASKFGVFGVTPAAQVAANADTSGATLGQLETEVNELKALLRTFGFLAT